MRSTLNQILLIVALAAFAFTCSFIAALADPSVGNDPTGGSASLTEFHKELAERKSKLVPMLSSNDSTQVQQAMEEIDDWTQGVTSARRADILILLVDTKHFDEAEQRAVAFILKSPANNYAIEHLQKLRVHSFLRQKKNAEALSAAKVYYDICRFAETKDAISLVSLCLLSAHPDDPTIAARFKQQQVAWATTQPLATASSTTAPTTTPSLGDPILPSIAAEQPLFDEAAIEARPEMGYISMEAKGNLLLFCGHADEAKSVFERAYQVASDEQMPGAIENIARAIRAKTGSVGEANQYLKEIQQPQNSPNAAHGDSGAK